MSLFLATLFCLLTIGGVFAAAAGQNNATAGEQGYVSLHQYVSRTEMKDVYRVELQVQTQPIETAPVYVSFVLDATGSMTKYRSNDPQYMDFYTDSLAMAGGRPTYTWNGNHHVERAVGAVYAMHEALDVLKASQNPENIYVNVFTYNSMSLTGLLNGGDGAVVSPASWNSAGSGSNFVPLLDPGDPSRINPVLASATPLADIAQVAGLYDNTVGLVPAYNWMNPEASSNGAIQNLGNITSAVAAYLSIVEGEMVFSQVSNTTGLASAVAPIFGYRLQQNGRAKPPSATHDTAGNYIGDGLAGAYRDLRALKNDAANAEAIDYENAKKYVLMLADGNDNVFATTQGWSLAIKAPVGSQNVNVVDDTVAMPTRSTTDKIPASVGGGYETLGATLWSVGFGRYTLHYSNWRSQFFANTTQPGLPWTATGHAYWSLMAAANNSTAHTEPHIIAMAVNNGVNWNGLIQDYNALFAGPPPAAAANVGNLNNVLKLYQNHTNSAGFDADYRFVTHLSQGKQNLGTVPAADFQGYPIVPGGGISAGQSFMTNAAPTFPDEEEAQYVFGQFAEAALQNMSDMVVQSNVNTEAFSLFQYPGKPLLDASIGTASASGNKVSWDIGTMPYGSMATLVFYVAMSEGVNPDLSYIVTDSSLRYKRPDPNSPGVMLDAFKPFEQAYIRYDGSIEQGGPAGGGAAPMPTPSPDSGSMMPLFAIPYGDAKVHAPSVTAGKTTLQEAKLQEKPTIENETVADAGEEIPVANTSTQGELLCFWPQPFAGAVSRAAGASPERNPDETLCHYWSWVSSAVLLTSSMLDSSQSWLGGPRGEPQYAQRPEASTLVAPQAGHGFPIHPATSWLLLVRVSSQMKVMCRRRLLLS